jgi:hypothetical protein
MLSLPICQSNSDYGGLEMFEARRPVELEAEYWRLEHWAAELMLGTGAISVPLWEKRLKAATQRMLPRMAIEGRDLRWLCGLPKPLIRVTS